MELRELETDEEYQRAIPIIQQLWTDADASFIRSWAEEDGYRLFGLHVDGTLVGVVGISIQRVLHHTRHVWVHDLVIDEAHRSNGYGTQLLSFVAEWAREHDCEYVALAGRLGNEEARQFYESNGMVRWGHVFETEIETH
ncbi:GNAT family N-acetyltransferase [Halocatena marina]|uniref:GNAT family N-acetyltransferase n=1 Tax=Halocatena marina TaxID=2934937 RepID=A0ABD5YUB3_9EURY|nr:GNAT family N-acetyltransferase [Halocatena marina]